MPFYYIFVVDFLYRVLRFHDSFLKVSSTFNNSDIVCNAEITWKVCEWGQYIRFSEDF